MGGRLADKLTLLLCLQGAVPDTQWQRAISERGEVVCPTCSIVTRKTVHGLKKHMEICQKVSGRNSCYQNEISVGAL